jgi:hypothetical protein
MSNPLQELETYADELKAQAAANRFSLASFGLTIAAGFCAWQGGLGWWGIAMVWALSFQASYIGCFHVHAGMRLTFKVLEAIGKMINE